MRKELKIFLVLLIIVLCFMNTGCYALMQHQPEPPEYLLKIGILCVIGLVHSVFRGWMIGLFICSLGLIIA